MVAYDGASWLDGLEDVSVHVALSRSGNPSVVGDQRAVAEVQDIHHHQYRIRKEIAQFQGGIRHPILSNTITIISS